MTAIALPGGSVEAPLLRLEDALERMLEGVEPLAAEDVSLSEATAVLGRVLAVDVRALVTMPPWDDSAMDGYAVRAADIAGATADRPIGLRVVGEAAAGRPASGVVETGTAMRILTGAPVPSGADAVVPVEGTDAPAGRAALPDAVAVRQAVRVGAHLRSAGSSLEAGRVVVSGGTVIGSRHVGVLVAAGLATAPLHARPRVAVVSTGDELTEPGAVLGPGSIYDSNGPSVAAQAVAAGARVVALGRAPDDLAAVESMLRASIQAADVVIVSGGVSLGAHDVVKEAFERVGRMDLWRVAVQPGKPLAFGRARSRDGRPVLLFGLPGNPVSSYVTFELFARPVLRRLAGDPDPLRRPVVRARLLEPVTKALGRRAFLRVTVSPAQEDDADCRWSARPAGGQGSHMLGALAHGNALAVVPEEVDGLPAGAEVDAWLLDGGG